MEATNATKSIMIEQYAEKDLEYVIDRHRTLYDIEYSLGPEFGDYVEKYARLFHQKHGEREQMWVAKTNGKPVGAIAVVCADDAAQLRWFLIEPETRGSGLGQRLFKTALDFCREKGYTRAFLWTLGNLKTARHIYEKNGFVRTESIPNDTWAPGLTEERWDLNL